MSDLNATYQYIDQHSEAMVEDLRRLVQQTSVTSSGLGVTESAELLATMMRDVGIDARPVPTDGLPVVFGEIRADDPNAPTLLHYSHYDVQPGDEDDPAWESPPFEARRTGDRIVGRG